VDRSEFRKAVIFYEKAFDLPSSFASRHSRESSKDSSNNFASPKLSLPDKLPQLDLTDQIVQAREQFSSSLTSVSPTPLSSEFSAGNPEQQITTSDESSNMSGLTGREPDFAESTEQQPSSSKNQDSTETTPDSMFSAAQRSEIANIVAAAVRSIQMQQPTPPPTTGAPPILQAAAEYTKE
jgi:hypothetical protein